jgi:hypothetical protein
MCQNNETSEQHNYGNRNITKWLKDCSVAVVLEQTGQNAK